MAKKTSFPGLLEGLDGETLLRHKSTIFADRGRAGSQIEGYPASILNKAGVTLKQAKKFLFRPSSV